MLYIVSTPIGNLKDITIRAIDVLGQVDIIAAEDTRRTKILLNHYNIRYKSMVSYNDTNRERRIPYLLMCMKAGKTVALVSDAGTPGISDPGFRLIRESLKNGMKVVPVPGASAILSALVSSGLPTDSFVFYGFVPKKQGQKAEFFRRLGMEKRTAIVYESPYRIQKTLSLMKEVVPQKKVCLAREMTKMFEEFLYGSPEEILSKIEGRTLKGEIVLILS